MSLTVLQASQAASLVGSTGSLGLAPFQAQLQALSQSLCVQEATVAHWQRLQDTYCLGLASPMVRGFLEDTRLPQYAGIPKADELRRVIDDLVQAASLGPIRRSDSIAQNTPHTWSRRSAVLQGKRRLSYQVLDKRADIIGTFLSGCLKNSGKRVAIFFNHNRSQVFEIALGARRAGIGFTNFHSHLSGEDFVRRIQDSPYAVLFMDSESLLKIEEFLPLLLSQGKVIIDIQSHHPDVLAYGRLFDEIKTAVASTPDTEPPRYPGPVMCSSGTTGEPKLINVRTTVGVGSTANRLFGIKESDRNLVVGQLYHGGAYSWAKGHLNRGAEVVLTERSGLTLDPEDVLSTVEKKKITNFWISPTWLQGLCLYMDEVQRPFDLSSLRAIFVGAAPFHPAIKKAAVQHFGPIVWENYAATEFGLISVLTPRDLLTHASTMGRPAPGVGIEIRNEQGERIPKGEPGRIYISNELTGNEYRPSDDYGVFDEEGYLTVLGRTVERMIVGGRALYPRPLENAVMEMPGVRDVHALEVQEGDEARIALAMVSKSGQRINSSEVIRFLSQRDDMQVYLQTPLRIVPLSSIPRVPYKVNVRVLREIIGRYGSKSRP